MSTKTRSLKESVWYLLALGGQAGALLVVLPAISHFITASGFGALSIAQVVAAVLAALLSLGMPAVITRNILLETSQTSGAPDVNLGLLFTAGTGALVLTSGRLWYEPVTGAPWDVTSISGVIAGIALSIVGVLQARMRAEGRALAFSVLAVTTSVGAWTLAAAWAYVSHGDAAGPMTVYATTASAVALISAFREVGKGFPTLNSVRAAIRIGTPTMPHVLALLVISGGIRVITAKQHGLAVTGAVSLALVIGMAPLTLLSGMNNQWAPQVYRHLRERDDEYLRSSLLIVTISVALIATIASALTDLVGELLVPRHMDTALVTSAAAIAFMAAPVFPLYLGNMHCIVASGYTSAMAAISPLSACLGIASVWPLIDKSAALGAGGLPASYILLALGSTLWRKRVSSWRPALARPLVVVLVTEAVLMCMAFIGPPLRRPLEGIGAVLVVVVCVIVWKGRRHG